MISKTASVFNKNLHKQYNKLYMSVTESCSCIVNSKVEPNIINELYPGSCASNRGYNLSTGLNIIKPSKNKSFENYMLVFNLQTVEDLSTSDLFRSNIVAQVTVPKDSITYTYVDYESCTTLVYKDPPVVVLNSDRVYINSFYNVFNKHSVKDISLPITYRYFKIALHYNNLRALNMCKEANLAITHNWQIDYRRIHPLAFEFLLKNKMLSIENILETDYKKIIMRPELHSVYNFYFR